MMSTNIKKIGLLCFIGLWVYLSYPLTAQNYNTFRTNEFEFYTGLKITDGIGSMIDSIPKNVCYDMYHSVCEETYFDYVQSIQPPELGTINVKIEPQGSDSEAVLNILLSDLYVNGDSILVPTINIRGSIGGFNMVWDEGVSNNAYLYQDPSNDSIKAVNPEGQDHNQLNAAFTYLQVGRSLYGESLWVRADVNTDYAAINAFEAINWALEPVGALPLGINAITEDGTSSTVTFMTKFIEVDPAHGVCISNKEWQGCDDPDLDTSSQDTQQGLFVNGSVKTKNLLGKIGLVDYSVDVGEEITMSDFENKDSKSATFIKKHLITLNPVEGVGDEILDDYRIAYIGYAAISGADTDGAVQMWMEVGQNSDDTCSPNNGLSDNLITLDVNSAQSYTFDYGHSARGVFDFQDYFNEAASFVFFIVEDTELEQSTTSGIPDMHGAVNNDGSIIRNDSSQNSNNIKMTYTETSDGSIQRYVKFCGKKSDGQGNHANDPQEVTTGVLVYGLPVGSSDDYP